jgi:glycine/serine hydroxymethyltransferase
MARLIAKPIPLSAPRVVPFAVRRSPVSFSGKMYHVTQYGVDLETEVLDYGVVDEIARKVRPKMIVCGASAYPREIDFKAFQQIADGVEAYCMADIAHIAGLCASGVHNTSVGVVDFTTTTTHKTLRGPRGGAILCDQENAVWRGVGKTDSVDDLFDRVGIEPPSASEGTVLKLRQPSFFTGL